MPPGSPLADVLTFEREGRPRRRQIEGRILAGLRARRRWLPTSGLRSASSINPENFWNPAFQQHANGANEIGGAVLVAENPSDHHIFLSAFTGERELHATSSGITAPTPRGDIQIMDAAAFADRYGLPAPDISAGARLAALRFAVNSPARLEHALTAGGIPFSRIWRNHGCAR